MASVRTKYNASQALAEIGIINDPFARTTVTPKIPDGKAQLSAGERFQNLSQLDITGEVSYVLLCPLFGAAAIVLHAPGANAAAGAAPTTAVIRHGWKHGVWVEQDPAGAGNPASTLKQHEASGGVSHWRIVSQGCKLSLLNTEDNSDGWFEVVRLNVNTDVQYFRSVALQGDDNHGANNQLDPGLAQNNAFNAQLNNRYCIPLLTPTGAFDINMNDMISHPTYYAGKLKDIHLEKFILTSKKAEHDFIDVNDAYVGAGQGFQYSNEFWVRDNIDTAWDMVLIKINGRAAAPQSKLLLHTIQNQEVKYKSNASLARFMTLSHKPPTQIELARNQVLLNKDVPRRGIRSAQVRRAPMNSSRSVRRRTTSRPRRRSQWGLRNNTRSRRSGPTRRRARSTYKRYRR